MDYWILIIVTLRLLLVQSLLADFNYWISTWISISSLDKFVPSTTDGQMSAYVIKCWNISKVGRSVMPTANHLVEGEAQPHGRRHLGTWSSMS